MAPLSGVKLNLWVEEYPSFLASGDRHEAPALRDYASSIEFSGLSAASVTPCLSAVNLFLRLSEDLARKESAAYQDVEAIPASCRVDAVFGLAFLSRHEVNRLKNESVLGSVIRSGLRITRPRGLRASARQASPLCDQRRLDFPVEYVKSLADAANNWRDRALWLGQAASGLRQSEMLNLQLADVDPIAERLWIHDPEKRRFANQSTSELVQRFKGRAMSEAYMFEPFRSAFFEALRNYLNHEFRPNQNHTFLFQYVSPQRGGEPYVQASDSARQQTFRRAVKICRAPTPLGLPGYQWTPHSLRHLFGVFMLNYLPVPGGFGLRLHEVQMLMGHQHISSTQHYARLDREIVRGRFEFADQAIWEGSYSLDRMPAVIAARLRHAASIIESTAGKVVDSRDVQ